MGLSKVQQQPDEFPAGYFTEEMTSPLTFFSTLDAVERNEDGTDEYDFLPLEEMEIGMVTEVTTTEEDEQRCFHDDIAAVEECGSLGKDADAESWNQDDQLSSEGGSIYVSSVLEEIIENNEPDVDYDINCNFLECISQNIDQNLDNNVMNIDEIIPGVDNDYFMSWLSSLNETTTINDNDLDVSGICTTSNDRTLAKKELRSFLLTRKTKTTDIVNHQDNPNQRHSLRPRTGSVTGRLRKYDDYDSSEFQRLRKRQERNRMAAQKCRQKRTKLVDELSEESEKLKKQNEELTTEVRDLMKEMRMLQNVLLDHDLHSLSSQCHERMSASVFNHELTDLF